MTSIRISRVATEVRIDPSGTRTLFNWLLSACLIVVADHFVSHSRFAALFLHGILGAATWVAFRAAIGVGSAVIQRTGNSITITRRGWWCRTRTFAVHQVKCNLIVQGYRFGLPSSGRLRFAAHDNDPFEIDAGYGFDDGATLIQAIADLVPEVRILDA